MASSDPPRNRKSGDLQNLRARRLAAGFFLVLGLFFLVLATWSSPALRNACLLLGLVLAVPALICLGADLYLRRAERAIQGTRFKND